MKTKWIQAIVAVAAVAVAGGLMAGCDDAETDSALQIVPANSVITGQGTTLFLTASDPDAVDASATNLNDMAILPLQWSVSNPTLGRILSSAGYNAVYESHGGRGQNIVIVTDRFGREGLAVVNHRWESELEDETPAATLL